MSRAARRSSTTRCAIRRSSRKPCASRRLPALRYAGPAQPQTPLHAGELAQLRLRYKLPGQERSRLLQSTVATASATATAQPSTDLRFAAAVAAYADLLRGGAHIDGWDWAQVTAAARAATGADRSGERREFVELLAIGQRLALPEATPPVQVSTR